MTSHEAAITTLQAQRRQLTQLEASYTSNLEALKSKVGLCNMCHRSGKFTVLAKGCDTCASCAESVRRGIQAANRELAQSLGGAHSVYAMAGAQWAKT